MKMSLLCDLFKKGKVDNLGENIRNVVLTVDKIYQGGKRLIVPFKNRGMGHYQSAIRFAFVACNDVKQYLEISEEQHWYSVQQDYLYVVLKNYYMFKRINQGFLFSY